MFDCSSNRRIKRSSSISEDLLSPIRRKKSENFEEDDIKVETLPRLYKSPYLARTLTRKIRSNQNSVSKLISLNRDFFLKPIDVNSEDESTPFILSPTSTKLNQQVESLRRSLSVYDGDEMYFLKIIETLFFKNMKIRPKNYGVRLE